MGGREEATMPTKPLTLSSRSIPPVPVELAGKWVAWNSEHSQIVAHSDSLEALWQIVRDQGIVDPVFEKTPRVDVRFVGMR